MGKFDGILICTDLDGTLLGSDHKVSPENKAAINYFKSEGGYFTFITGRPPMIIGEIFEAADPNAPFGCMNGGGLYDGKKKEYVYYTPLDRKALELVAYVDNAFPEVGIQINTPDTIFFSKESSAMEYFREVTGVPDIVRDYNDIKEPITKIIFADTDAERIKRLANGLAMHPLAEDFAFTRSESFLYEILPKGINKAHALWGLSKLLGIDMKRTIALGDYENDIEMIRAAGVGIAMGNARDAVKAASDLVTVSNDEHALARIVGDIDSGRIKM